jgi:hypothetical protein
MVGVSLTQTEASQVCGGSRKVEAQGGGEAYLGFEFSKLAPPAIEFNYVLALWRGGMGVGGWSGFDGGAGFPLYV